MLALVLFVVKFGFVVNGVLPEVRDGDSSTGVPRCRTHPLGGGSTGGVPWVTSGMSPAFTSPYTPSMGRKSPWRCFRSSRSRRRRRGSRRQTPFCGVMFSWGSGTHTCVEGHPSRDL